MFFPIDRRINERFPYATIALVTLNAVAFLWVYLAAGNQEGLKRLFEQFGVVPNNIQLHAVVSHMFMHGGVPHLTGNMLFLALFGMNVERKLGAPLYLILYFLAGLCSLGLFLVFSPHSTLPLVGASGAISGVCGMYLALFAKRDVQIYWYALFWGGFANAPAWAFILLWIGMELAQAIFLSKVVMVAHWAHVGGFIGGWGLLTGLRLTGYRGYPETVAVEPSNEPDFRELEFIPESKRSLPETFRQRRADLQTCMLVAREYRLPPVISDQLRGPFPPILPATGNGTGTPDHVAGGLAYPDAVRLQKNLDMQGYPTIIAVENYRVNLPLLAPVKKVELFGPMIRFRDEMGRTFDRDPRLLYHTVTGRVGPRRVLDLFLTGPWTDYRVVGVDEETIRRIRQRFGTTEGRDHSGMRQYDEYLSWELQLKASAVRSRSSAGAPAPEAPPPDGPGRSSD